MTAKNVWIFNQEATTPKYGYVHHRHYYLAKEYVKKGYSVSIFASNFSHFFQHLPPNEKAFNYEQLDGISFCWIRSNRYKNPNGIGRIISWLYYILLLFFIPVKKYKKPDIIVLSSTSVFPIIPAIFYKLFFKTKLIFEVRDPWPRTLIEIGGYSRYNPLILMMEIAERLSYKFSDFIVGTMPNLGVHIARKQKKFNFKCIPQGIDLDFYSQDLMELDPKFVEDYIPKDKFIIGYAGTIGLSNALETVIEAAKILQTINPQIHFVLLGDGKTKPELMEMAKGVTNITFAPRLAKNYVNSFLEKCDVLYDSVMSIPLYEVGLSRNKWMDYMYAGKPIIASYTGYMSLINEANSGEAVPSENTSLLVAKIQEYAEKPSSELLQMGQRAKEFVLKNRSYESLANQYIQIFN